MRNALVSWLVFVLLGAGMWMLRYGDVLDARYLNLLIEYGPWSVLIIHGALVLMAFQDNIFQGILTLLIPGYSLYWLFAVCDFFLVRAIVAGLMVGIGQDSAAFYQHHFNEIVMIVRRWIESGG